jgi:pimeloyl-ACP methyl ester carboxylesterase/uncharacterized protein YndB with AHSA1/START domain
MRKIRIFGELAASILYTSKYLQGTSNTEMNTVTSKDGTQIAFEKTGNGPVVILVDGAFCSKDFGPTPKLVPVLANNFTVISYDRRARGDSSDTQPYSVQREIEDIEALINVVGATASLYGVSSGAVLCIEAVASGLPVKKLVIFEPPYYTDSRRNEPPSDAERQLNQMIAEGRKKDAVKFYLRKVIGVPAIVPFILRLTPNWSKMIANANSLPYDAAVMGNFKVPKNVLASINIPVMVIASAKSPQSLRKPSQVVAELLSAGKYKILKGQIHNVSPKTLVPELVKFFNNENSCNMKSEKNLTTEKSVLINADATKIWDILTNPDKIKIYLFNSEAKTDWKVGSPVTFSRMSEGKEYVDKGKILEVVPHKLLKFSYFSSQEGYADIPANYSIITYTLQKESEDNIKLIYRREHIPIEFEQKNQEKFLPSMLENIKKLAEEM